MGTIAAVIPCYKVSETVKDVIKTLPDIFDLIIVVDDACPESSGKVAEATGRENLVVLYNDRNLGVGGAVKRGYRKALDSGSDIVVKIDGDGQMDPSCIAGLVAPLLRDEADYVKGNRFIDYKTLGSMPFLRLMGNSALSFILKLASGYWDIMDPTNGFTAIHRRVLEKLDLSKISNRYFFESDMLIRLGIARAVVKDLSMPSRYGAEGSSLSVWKALFQFPPRLFVMFVKRIILMYYVFDFNMASLYMLVGFPMMLFGVVFGAVTWYESYSTGVFAPLGSIMLSVLPITLAFQMLLQAVSFDISRVPRRDRR